MDGQDTLTGVWHGLYSYPRQLEPVYFVATLIGSGARLSGMIHEANVGRRGAKLQLFASVEGEQSDSSVSFDKVYDGTGGWSHKVIYIGTLNSDRTEIEGNWSIPSVWSGRFLMLRSRGMTETAIRQIYETV